MNWELITQKAGACKLAVANKEADLSEKHSNKANAWLATSILS